MLSAMCRVAMTRYAVCLSISTMTLLKTSYGFAGDIVNRGPQSLETLNFIRSLGEGAKWVIGNHELHLLKLAERFDRSPSKHT